MESPTGGGLSYTSVVVLTLDSGEVYIVCSLSIRSDTQVIYIDPSTGALCYNGKWGNDIFKSEREALDFLMNGSRQSCRTSSTIFARAVLGYAALGSCGLLLVATKLGSSIPDPPGGGCVYSVMESQWIQVPLQNPQPRGKGELKNMHELMELDIDGKYYFCETRDITRPFPSRMPIEDPDDEFVWNGWLSILFKRIGLPRHCVVLLQGFAECRKFGSLGQQEGIVSLIARRSRLHPGTRYLARGLNSCSSTGNEVECEQLVWVPKKAGQSVPFSRYIWRRGTIPMWWGAELKKITAAEAEIYVAENEPYKGSPQYYQRLSRRYDARNFNLVSGGSQKKNPLVPVVCINLLRNGEGKSESLLVHHFEESLNYVRSTGMLPYTRIMLMNYDWHANIKLMGEPRTIEGLWELVKAPTISIGISEGDYLPSRQRTPNCIGEIIHTDEYEGAFCLRSCQNGVLRFNCADSLDRTNAASFFGALQVFVEQCKRLGISLDSGLASGYDLLDSETCITPLPPGWEKRSDAVTGRVFYMDHNTRATSWNHPCPEKLWKRFDLTFEEFKRSTVLLSVSQIADLFLLAGDIHATLYTGSKAMHSQILSIFNDEGGKFKKFSAAQSMKITLQRRYKNVVVDSSRQKQLEIFLGMRLYKHLPSVPFCPLHVTSRPPACFLKPVPGIPGSAGDISLLSFNPKNSIWVCPEAADVIQLFIYLSEPCHVCKLLLTVSHGADDSTFPAAVDVRTGRDLDGLKLVLECGPIPHCANGTNISIPLSGPVSSEDIAVTDLGSDLHGPDVSRHALLYNFEELEGELDFLTRVVALTFYPSVSGRTPITLGEVEVLGVSIPWKSMFTCEEPASSLLEQAKRGNKSNRFMHDLDANLHPPLSLTEDVPIPLQRNSSSIPLDLLSGDLVNSSVDAVDSGSSQSQLVELQQSGTKQYTNFVKSCMELQTRSKPDFVEAMKLEIERLHLNLSAAERDRALLSMGIDSASVNPNVLVDDLYMVKVCRVASSLAQLGQIEMEDKITGSIGLENKDINIIDFWNVVGIGEKCYGGMCKVQAERQGSASEQSVKSSFFICNQCGREVCKMCCAGKGALLLGRRNPRRSGNAFQGHNGSNHDCDIVPSGNQYLASEENICKLCCNDIILHALILDYIRMLLSLRRTFRMIKAAGEALDLVMGFTLTDRVVEGSKTPDPLQADAALRKLLNGDESLAEFPFASFLHSVGDTAVDSAHPLSLLAPLHCGPQDAYWKATTNSTSVDFAIFLGSLSDVSGVVLIVSPCGYSESDAPSVQIWTSTKISKEEGSCMGTWDVHSLLSSSRELYGPEKHGAAIVPRHVKFSFRNPVRCRIVWITICLERQPGSSSLNFEEDSSSDVNPSAVVSRSSSSPGQDKREPCLHARRILIVGSSARDETDLTSKEASNHLKLNLTEFPPRLSRFKVPVEAERLMDNDLVLEIYLSPTLPLLAGFRLDAFSAIQPRVRHIPGFNVMRDCLFSLLDERHINPALLHIRVSILQEPQHKMVTVAEYRLPVVKPGTAMYFDFPKELQTQRILFRLVGDVIAFSDDPEERDDAEYRGSLIPGGLSLSGRIKLYHYADAYEVGKWAAPA